MSDEYTRAQDVAEQQAVDAFLKGYRAGHVGSQPTEQEAYDVTCEVRFDINSDSELSEVLLDEVRYKAALLAAVKIGLSLGYNKDEVLDDIEEAINDFVLDEFGE